MPPDDRIPFQLYGLQRTGTNLAVRYMTEFFNGRRVVHGWKHGNPIWEPPLKTIITVKDPKSWVWSFWRWCNVQKGATPKMKELSSFLRMKIPKTQMDPISLYNYRYRKYLEGEEIALVHHMSTVCNMPTAFVTAAEKLGMKATKPLKTIRERVGPTGRKQMDLQVYRDRSFLQHFSREDIDWVNTQIDSEVLEGLGYGS